jgi:hypothetical protein
VKTARLSRCLSIVLITGNSGNVKETAMTEYTCVCDDPQRHHQRPVKREWRSSLCPDTKLADAAYRERNPDKVTSCEKVAALVPWQRVSCIECQAPDKGGLGCYDLQPEIAEFRQVRFLRGAINLHFDMDDSVQMDTSGRCVPHSLRLSGKSPKAQTSRNPKTTWSNQRDSPCLVREEITNRCNRSACDRREPGYQQPLLSLSA